MKTFEDLKIEFFSDNIDLKWKAQEELVKMGTEEVVQFLLPLLQDTKVEIRDLAGLALGEIGDNRAFEPLLKEIKKPINKNNCGSLVHALTGLDCSGLFLFLVNLALYGNYEVQSHALSILKAQFFDVTKGEIANARKMIEQYLELEEQCQDYELLIDELNEYIDKVEDSID